jgi:hypothetical protein
MNVVNELFAPADNNKHGDYTETSQNYLLPVILRGINILHKSRTIIQKNGYSISEGLTLKTGE